MTDRQHTDAELECYLAGVRAFSGSERAGGVATAPE